MQRGGVVHGDWLPLKGICFHVQMTLGVVEVMSGGKSCRGGGAMCGMGAACFSACGPGGVAWGIRQALMVSQADYLDGELGI